MTSIIESVRNVFKRDNTVEFDAENVGNALVRAHHYLHHVLYAGNYNDAGKPIPNRDVPVSDGEPSTQKKNSD